MRDEITNGTGTAAAWTGSADENFAFQTVAPLGGILTIFGNHYIQNPEGTSDYVTLFNNVFPLFDTFPDDQASTAAATVAQLAGDTSDLSSSFNTDAADTGWLADKPVAGYRHPVLNCRAAGGDRLCRACSEQRRRMGRLSRDPARDFGSRLANAPLPAGTGAHVCRVPETRVGRRIASGGRCVGEWQRGRHR
ncbi:MAG: hypothetical protein WA942_11655 [Mycolicibacter sinensis]